MKGMGPRHPITLINCETRTLTISDGYTAYIALSYVWGETVAAKNDFKAQVLPESIPAVVQDALTVTTKLGYRYLWVDRYCIDQEDAESVSHQVGQMDEVYHGADLTIIAAAGDSGDDGLTGANKALCDLRNMALVEGNGGPSSRSEDFCPKQAIRLSKWASRGWTFQESLLSCRRLVFTKDVVYFECAKMSCWELHGSQRSIEGIILDEHLASSTKRGPLIWDFPSTNIGPMDLCSEEAMDAMSTIWTQIHHYSKRDLTLGGDALRAFQGVLNRMHYLFNGQLKHLWGVPYFSHDGGQSDFTSQRSFFLENLCWHQAYTKYGSRRDELPSWSWVGHEGLKSGGRQAFPMSLSVNEGTWNRATLHSIQNGKRGSNSILDLEAILLNGCSFWTEQDSVLVHFDQGDWYCAFKFDCPRHWNLAEPQYDIFQGIKYGTLRACVMFGVYKRYLFGLLVTKATQNLELYCRVGRFELRFDSDKRWMLDDELETSDLRSVRFLLE